MNFSSCKVCSKNNIVVKSCDLGSNSDSDSDEDDGDVEMVENVKFLHQCGNCQHQIAIHKVIIRFSELLF